MTIQTGSIEITTIPVGAEVFIDSEGVGNYESSPIKVKDLSLGKHNATARLEGHSQGSKDFLVAYRKDVSLKLILRPMSGALFLSSEPIGAQIIIDRKKY